MDLKTGVGVLALAKFHHNQDLDSSNKMITRTLGKFGIISKTYTGEMPTEDEFWIVRIINNIRPEEHQGCFILEPLKKVDYSKQIGKLVNGMYEEILSENKHIIYIKPLEKFENYVWQLTLEDRKRYPGKSVIVIQNEKLLYNIENHKYEETNGGNENN